MRRFLGVMLFCVLSVSFFFYSLFYLILFFFFQAEDGIRDLVRSRGLGDVYKRQAPASSGSTAADASVLRDRLLFEERIEVKVHAYRGRVHLRVSAQVYNLSLIHI